MCPIVPTFTCGLLRSNFSLAMSTILACPHVDIFAIRNSGADVQDRTGDLVLTKDALCQLSYIGPRLRPRPTGRPSYSHPPSGRLASRSSRRERRLERETGIEPATNSLEGCDSTTELLPLTPVAVASHSGGEGRTRTFEAARATDLQSAAFDRFATSPIVCVECDFERSPRTRASSGAGEGIRTPDLLITNQLLYRPELRQPDKRGTLARPVPAVQPPGMGAMNPTARSRLSHT